MSREDKLYRMLLQAINDSSLSLIFKDAEALEESRILVEALGKEWKKEPIDNCCPKCGKPVDNNYCPSCGQHLDWR